MIRIIILVFYVTSVTSNGVFRLNSSFKWTKDITSKNGRHTRSIRPRCPQPNGLFPFEGDCAKYVNCANNYGYIQSCAPGTLFNPLYSTCDWPHNVDCDANSPTTEVPQYFTLGFPTGEDSTTKNPSKIPEYDSFDDFDNDFGTQESPEVTTPTYTKTAEAKKAVGTQCFKDTGQFPYPKDCSKFVNCWHGRATVQACAPGTLFDASTLKCVWPHNAICSSETQELPVEPREVREAKNLIIPSSGQTFRLEGQGSPAVGYLQVYRNHSWIYVVNTDESWDYENKVCQQLGYERGLSSSSRGFVYGQPKYVMTSYADCTGLKNLNCTIKSDKNIQNLFFGVIGIRCAVDSLSQCPPNWYRWGTKCFFVEKESMKTKNQAARTCKNLGGDLTSIESQGKHNYLSDLLLSLRQTEAFHTNGLIRIRRSQQFLKWGHQKPIHINKAYNNMWPGWLSEKEAALTREQLRQLDRNCVLLKSEFSLDQQEITVPYYFQKIETCHQKQRFICEADIKDIGCIHGTGQNYMGPANVTASGASCLPWNDYELTVQPHTTKPRANFCANPNGEISPWCFTGRGLLEHCDIPRCVHNDITQPEEDLQCSDGLIPCPSGDCIYSNSICDGKKDCADGEDESQCPDYSNKFWSIGGYKMGGNAIEKWEESQQCLLFDKHAAVSGGLVACNKWSYYYLSEYDKNCSSSISCSDFKCLEGDQVCDGHADCPGAEDEQKCGADFEVRLSGGNGKNEGRVEAKAFGRWGVICHDAWDLQDGHVVCKELGYSKGAKQVHTHSKFGSGVLPYIMDDMNCVGGEQSLSECEFPGWGSHDCKMDEEAGVTCYEESENCADDDWTCDNGLCIPLSFYCDSVDDCYDGSDEKPERCMAPVEVRLVTDTGRSAVIQGPDNAPILEGRVEIRYQGLWGTVCDDDIDLDEGHVICRSMGWNRAEKTFKESAFGPGEGPIWMDGLNCMGDESSLMKCHYKSPLGRSICDHTEDLGVRCVNDTTPIKVRPFHNTEAKLGRSLRGLPEECGNKYVDDNPKNILASPRVIDGMMPIPGANPWMAAIRKKSARDTTHYCGAAILSDTLLLTAAHCVISYPSGTYLLRTGDFNNEERDLYEEEWQIEKKIVHPDFNKAVHFDNDIALIKLKPKNGKGIKFNQRVQPLCLPPVDWNYTPGLNCTVAGWGSTGSDGYSQLLLSAILPIIDDTTCKADYIYGKYRLTRGMFCAGYLEGGIDTCQGDSGGPLVCNVDGRYTAVGIISWGHGCARANKPGVYTKLTEFIGWINQNIYKLT